MRSRILPFVGGGLLAIAVAASYGLPASAHTTAHPGLAIHSAVSQHVTPRAGDPDPVCYDQSANDNGVGIVSQNFEAAFDIYDSQGADDFTWKGGKGCKGLSDVSVAGAYFNGSGPADSFNVTIYANVGKGQKSHPGKALKTCTAQPYTTDGLGFTVHLDKDDGGSCLKADYKVKVGSTHWVSVQANMNFSTGGEWGWNTNNTVVKDAAMWQNAGNGFSTGCTTYKTLTSCIAAGEGGDFTFDVLG